MKTLKQISEVFDAWVTAHPILNEYGFGDISDITTKDITYPLFWAMPSDTQLNKLAFEVYICDILEDDKTNLEDVMSAMLNIVYDFAKYTETYLYLDVDNDSISIKPFTGKFDDLTGGWQLGIEFDYINIEEC